jgi:hypothetical protein
MAVRCTVQWYAVRSSGTLYGPVVRCTVQWYAVRSSGTLYGPGDRQRILQIRDTGFTSGAPLFEIRSFYVNKQF